ncbi:MAG: hypothetical protein M3P08_05085 [Thermoproteota archaeon]|nr:hypothetical protein [Thermoproteota archaeon]
MGGFNCLLLSSARLSALLLIAMMTTYTFTNTGAYATIIAKNNTQDWVDKLNNVKIHFIYELNKPTINNLNELNFTADDWKTGNNLKNVIADVTVVNNPDPTFKFSNITSSNGDFSIKCPFLNEGMHHVIVNLRSNNNHTLALASFNLTVPITSNSS